MDVKDFNHIKESLWKNYFQIKFNNKKFVEFVESQLLRKWILQLSMHYAILYKIKGDYSINVSF